MEAARIVFGLSASILAPWGYGLHRSHPRLAAVITLGYGAYIVAPYVTQWRVGSALGASALLSLGWALWHHSSSSPSAGVSLTLPLSGGSLPMRRRAGVVSMGAAGVLVLWSAGAKATSLGSELLSSDRVAVVFSALLVAVFAGGVLAQTATEPVHREIRALPDGPEKRAAMDFVMSGGRGIGLLERGLLFAFLAAGQPDAAALVLAAKSMARVPANDPGRYASEYFLIGTLASVIASLATSIATRLVLGLPVL